MQGLIFVLWLFCKFNRLFILNAHEIGHNFAGIHGDGDDCNLAVATIMCVGEAKYANDLAIFSQASKQRIRNFINQNNNCLNNFTFPNSGAPEDIVGGFLLLPSPIPVAAFSSSNFLIQDSHPSGTVFNWYISNATITSGQGTSVMTA